MRTAIKFIGVYIGVSVFLGLIWMIYSYPDVPSSASQWVWVFVLALPLQFAFEFLGVAWNNKATRFVGQKTAASAFSPIRILYGVIYGLIFVALLLAAGYGWHAFQQLPAVG